MAISKTDNHPKNTSTKPEYKRLTIKEKIEILTSLERVPFDYSQIPKYLGYTSDLDLSKPILKKIIEKLVEIDTRVSACYELLPEEEWEQICSNYDTPDDKSAELKKNLTILNLNFVNIYESLKKLKIEMVLDVLSPLFKVKTRNIQFLLFLLAKDFPNQIFGFLISKLKRDPKNFSPFFSSLLVRLQFDQELKHKCIQAFNRHFNALNPSKSLNYLVLAQNLLYVLCFKEFSIAEIQSTAAKRLLDEDLLSYMNKNIVAKYCDIYGQKMPVMRSLKSECLYSFPFDLPISKPIIDLVVESFIEFK